MKFDDEICKGINCPECSFNKGEDGCLLAKRLDEIEITLEPCKDAVPSAQPELAQDLHSTCADAISRQAAIDALDEIESEVADGYGYQYEKWRKYFCGLPSAQPEQRWIPCSERLPKPYEYCLWTTTDGRVIYHHCDGLFSNYTAWMPLPEPYREEQE